jgi:hypothetical protein
MVYISDFQTGVRGPRGAREGLREDHIKHSKGAAERSQLEKKGGRVKKSLRTAGIHHTFTYPLAN